MKPGDTRRRATLRAVLFSILGLAILEHEAWGLRLCRTIEHAEDLTVSIARANAAELGEALLALRTRATQP